MPDEIKDFGDVVEKITGMPCERLPWSVIVRYEDEEKPKRQTRRRRKRNKEQK